MATKIAEPSLDERASTVAPHDEGGSGSHNRTPTAHDTRPPAPPRSVWREYIESGIVTVIMALFGITFVVQAVKVPTGSMQNTILIGDQLLVNKFIFAPGPVMPFLPQREIRRGDIIVFKYPGNKYDDSGDSEPNNIPYKTNYVKRVIGIPGDRIEIRGTQVFVNNQLLPERHVQAENPPDRDNPYTSGDETGAPLKIMSEVPATLPGSYTVYHDPERDPVEIKFEDTFTNGNVVIVPPDSYFAMGDNRENSLDSRFWGVVSRDLIVGRAMFVYWSYDTSAPQSSNPITNFFSNSRWSRTGTLVR
ncbi:MAG: signal peptidase I [Pyrinomonadaceae bacterium MAG19_C2-C3]|nr:signal peptidase I [Pyrinomonadaceae bacterium MAG19_C2-C3]